jgi:hypothetical protein
MTDHAITPADAHDVDVFLLTELLRLQHDAARGCVGSRRVVATMVSVMRRVITAPENQPVRCACCGQAIQPGPGALDCIGVVWPDALGFALCQRCGPEIGDEMMEIAVARALWHAAADAADQRCDGSDRRRT